MTYMTLERRRTAAEAMVALATAEALLTDLEESTPYATGTSLIDGRRVCTTHSDAKHLEQCHNDCRRMQEMLSRLIAGEPVGEAVEA